MPSGPESENPRRLAVDVGVAGGTLAALVGLHLLAFESELGAALAPQVRSPLWLVLSLLAFAASGRSLFVMEEELRGLPMARWATAFGGAYLLACALYDLVVPLSLPVLPLPLLAYGAALLAASVWSDSTLLALVGAELVDHVIASRLAALFGFAGGFTGAAVFFHMLTALVEIPLGFHLARRYRRALGVGVLANASFSLVRGLLFLGAYGVGVHGRPDQTWIHGAYLALAVVASVLLARLMARVSEGGLWDLSSRTVILTFSEVCERVGMPRNLAWSVALFAYWALDSGGVLRPAEDEGTALHIEPGMLDDPAQLEALMERLARAEPARMRWDRARQARAVHRTLAAIALGYAVLAAGAALNRGLASPEAFRVRLRTPRLEEWLRVKIDEVHLPEGLVRGQRLEGWMLPYEVDGARLRFTDLFVAPVGVGPPGDIPVESAWRVTGRYFRYRRYDGRVAAGMLVDQGLAFRVPESWRRQAAAGDVLVFAQGGLGYPYPASRLPAGEVATRSADVAPRGWLGIEEARDP